MFSLGDVVLNVVFEVDFLRCDDVGFVFIFVSRILLLLCLQIVAEWILKFVLVFVVIVYCHVTVGVQILR